MADPTELSDEIVIRAVEPEDYAALRDIYAQPLAMHGTLQMPFPSAETWRERVARQNPQRHFLVACAGGRPVGNIGLMVEANPRRRHAASIGMGVHDEYAGRGIGHALLSAALDIADNWLNLTRVELSVYTDNERAIRLYYRAGFEVEGTFRNFAFRNGVLVDALAMARFRPAE